MKLLVIALALAGCSVNALSGGDSGDAPPPVADPPSAECAQLLFDPPEPVASATTPVRITALGTPGTATYQWSVSRDTAAVTFAFVAANQSSIEILAATPGVYTISLDVMTASISCSTGPRSFNVRAPGAKVAHLRLRVVPPPGVLAAPLEQPLTVDGGASSDLGVVVVNRGMEVTRHVIGATGGVAAYLRFSPNGARDAVVEAFADPSGRFSTVLANDFHTILVVPSPGGVPRRITDWQAIAATDLFVSGGSTITGTVRDPANAPLVGATVELSVDGVPSTLATTDATGAFVLQAVTRGGAVTARVTPPIASGLPRLSATAAFDLGKPLQIRYATNLGLRSLAGLQVQRAGAGLARAQVMVVGTLEAIGTVSTGAPVTATGEVRIAVTADAAGTLPATLVPAARLSAVVTAGPGDLAVAALDTTTARPAVLDAPAPQVIATTARGSGGEALPRAVLDLVPTGALAMAAAPPLHVVGNGNGAFSASLAAGGHYDLRFVDPAGRAGPLVVTDRVATTVDSGGYALPEVVTVQGRLLFAGTQPLAGASVQVLCAICTGLDRAKPIAEAVSDGAGRFTLAVPDPGTM